MTRGSDVGGAEERLRFLLELSDALRTLEDPVEIQAAACARLGRHLRVNRVNYAEIENDAFVAMEGFVDGVAPLPAGAHPVADFGESLFEACRRGQDLVVEDVTATSKLTPAERANYREMQIAAFAAVPLTMAGRWVGIFSAQSATPRWWTSSSVQLIREVAERIWASTERARAEQARRESAERLRASEARQAFLLRLSDRLRLLTDPRQIMRAAAEMLARHLDVAAVQYTFLDADQEGAKMAGVYNDGRLPAALEGFRFKLSDYGAWAMTLRSGQEVFTSDNQRDWRGLVTDKTPMTGVRAGAAIPLLEDARLIAVLAAAHPEPRAWSEDERQLLRDAAARTYSAVLRARSEAALRESEAAATLANQAKDEFLATLGHELRTPLSAILLWAGLLKSGSVPPAELDRALEAILRSAESQSRLVEDLLDLSRLASGKLVLAPHSVIVGAVARAAIELVQASAAAKGVTVELVAGDCRGAALLDAARLQQVLLNLLSNAIKFTPTGGKATLRLRKHQGYLEVEVQDNGQGIASHFMPHIFERFRQADMGHARAHSGLGIGLALSRQLVELQGGTITAHSQGEGTGATFRVRLPWVDAEDTPEPVSIVGLASCLSAARLRGVTVLLVEDDVNTRDAMQWTLARAGTTVVRAGSGFEALELLDAVENGQAGAALPDVIVSDLGLPGMSGYELIQRIVRRQHERGQPPIPACAVSAHARDIDKLRAIDAGFDMYLVKPIMPEKLIAAVEDLKAVAVMHPA